MPSSATFRIADDPLARLSSSACGGRGRSGRRGRGRGPGQVCGLACRPRRRKRPPRASLPPAGAVRYEPRGASAKTRRVAINRHFESRSARPVGLVCGAGISGRRHCRRWDVGRVCGLGAGRHRCDHKQGADRNRRSQTGSAEPLHRRVPRLRRLRGDRVGSSSRETQQIGAGVLGLARARPNGRAGQGAARPAG
jgi:hypothetical protein